MLPRYPEFKSLEIEDLGSIKKYFGPQSVCELCPANLIIWKNFDHPKITLINNNLCILASPPNEPSFFLEPLGNHKIVETVDLCLKDSGKISRVSEGFLSKLPKDKYHLSCLRDQFDYVYLTKILAELKGKKYDGKRNHIKKFKIRHPNYEFRPLKEDQKNEALALFETWFSMRKHSRFFPKLAYSSQKEAVETAFVNFRELGLRGGALFVDNAMKGFVLGSALNNNTASIHFMYGYPSLQGTSQVLLWEACNKTFSDFTYLNLEQDLGIPGLRKAKLSYYPHKLEKKFEINPTPIK
ncbi:MAG: DUF2156 domain-containing protein [Candidatus Saganbacteria bacterium]|nr:DUF2156 domain-containing protein [Candidatus Saganbacteria bacterium]